MRYYTTKKVVFVRAVVRIASCLPLARSSIDVEAMDLLAKGDPHEFSNFLVKHQAKKYRKAERKLASSGSMSGSGGGGRGANPGEAVGKESEEKEGDGNETRGSKGSTSGRRNKLGLSTARARGPEGALKKR